MYNGRSFRVSGSREQRGGCVRTAWPTARWHEVRTGWHSGKGDEFAADSELYNAQAASSPPPLPPPQAAPTGLTAMPKKAIVKCLPTDPSNMVVAAVPALPMSTADAMALMMSSPTAPVSSTTAARAATTKSPSPVAGSSYTPITSLPIGQPMGAKAIAPSTGDKFVRTCRRRHSSGAGRWRARVQRSHWQQQWPQDHPDGRALRSSLRVFCRKARSLQSVRSLYLSVPCTVRFCSHLR